MLLCVSVKDAPFIRETNLTTRMIEQPLSLLDVYRRGLEFSELEVVYSNRGLYDSPFHILFISRQTEHQPLPVYDVSWITLYSFRCLATYWISFGYLLCRYQDYKVDEFVFFSASLSETITLKSNASAHAQMHALIKTLKIERFY